MKAFKFEILIIDHDGLGKDQITETIETARYPNRCISPDVKSVEEKDIGEWDDDHPLNSFGPECEKFYYKTFNAGSEEKLCCLGRDHLCILNVNDGYCRAITCQYQVQERP